jgi:murein L,D-transpeptidase YafK
MMFFGDNAGVGRAAARRLASGVAAVAVILALAACGGGGDQMSASMRPIPKETLDLMAKKGMSADKPIYVRIIKEDSELEVWKQRDDGRFHHFKSYPICNWSGDLGPKIREGDKQAPEGFYTVTQTQMNPNSQFHLAFNMGFPNAYDKAHGRTGAHLMVHGDCRSAGCYAMTDALVEEIYAIARESFKGGQEKFEVHAYPFRMTPQNMTRHAKSQWMPFWKPLKEGYDHFELTRQPAAVAVCEKRYVVNARFPSGDPAQADAACPPHQKMKPDLYVAKPEPAPGPNSSPNAKVAQDARVLAPGKKTRNLIAEAAGQVVPSSGSPSGSPAKPSQSIWGLGTGGQGASGRNAMGLNQ